MNKRNWFVGVITSPRQDQSLITNTLQSIADAGFMPHISNDADCSLGAYGNWRKCLAEGLERDVERILIVENDIQLSVGMRGYLDCFNPPPDGIASLYSAAPNDESDSYFGWLPIKKLPKRAYGALAYVMTPEIGRRFLQSAPLTDRPHGTDHAVGLWCRDNGVPYYVHAPSFAIHRGVESSLPDAGVPECRQCRRWIETIAVTISQGTIKARADVLDLATNTSRVVGFTRQAG